MKTCPDMLTNAKMFITKKWRYTCLFGPFHKILNTKNRSSKSYLITRKQKITKCNTFMAYFGRVRPQAGFSRETFSTNIAVEGSVFGPFYLRVVVAQMLLKIRQLDKGPAAVRKVAFVRAFSWKNREAGLRLFFQ